MSLSPHQLSVLGTPILLALMVAENRIRKVQGLDPYSQRQTLNNLGVFVGWRAIIAGLGLIPLWGYAWVLAHVAPWRLDVADPWTWVFGFFATDLAFWARHWGAHRVGLLWAMHAVHHQSREYNLSAAARLSWFSDTILVGIPLALIGLPLEVAGTWYVVANVWQLFQHTEVVGRLGVIDRVLLTPSDHRVHHGSNPQYLDKNYGSILVLWDRLFGTFAPEEERVRYGVLTGLRTYDATENNFEPFRALVRKVREAPGPWTAFQVLWRPPGWVPGTGEEQAVMIDEPEPQRAVKLPQWVRHVSTALITVTLAASLAIVWNTEVWPAPLRVGLAVVVLFGVAISGVVLDSRPVRPVPASGTLGRSRAWLSAGLLTLAGPYAAGPLYHLGRWIEPRPVLAPKAAPEPAPVEPRDD